MRLKEKMIGRVDGFAVYLKSPGHLFSCFYTNLSETSAPGGMTAQMLGNLAYKDQEGQMCTYQQDGA